MYARLFKTLSALLLGTGQEVLFQLLGALLWIHFWGVQTYSDWLLLSLIPVLTTRGAAGVFHTAASEMIQRVAESDYDRAAVVVSALRQAQRWCLSGAAVLFIVLSALLAVLSVDRQLSDLVVLMITALFIVQFALFQWQQAELNFLKADLQAPVAVLWQTAFRSVFIFAMLALSPIAGPAVCLATGVALQAVVLVMTRRRIRSLKSQYPSARASGQESTAVLRAGLQFSAFPLGQAALHNLAVWTLSLLATPLAGAAFHNMRTICRIVVLVARAAEQALRLELSAVYTHGKLDIAKGAIRRMIQMTWALGGVLLVGLWISGPWVFSIITRSALPFEFSTFALLGLSAFVFALAQPYSAALFATNRHGPMANRYLLILVTAGLITIPSALAGGSTVAIVILVADIALLVLARHTLVSLDRNVPEEASHVV